MTYKYLVMLNLPPNNCEYLEKLGQISSYLGKLKSNFTCEHLVGHRLCVDFMNDEDAVLFALTFA